MICRRVQTELQYIRRNRVCKILSSLNVSVCPAEMDEIKPRKNHHHHHHHHHHNQDSHPNRYTKFDDSDRNTDESRGPHCHHQHSRYLHDSPHHDAHYPRQFHPSEEDEILYDHHTPVTLSRASSSSLSSSSSSSSWYTESSANDPFSLHHAERPQHSLSCSNITDVHVGLREDEGSLPVVFATIKNNKKGSMFHESSQQTGNSAFSALDRSHSRSDEAFLKRNVSAGGEQSRHNNCGPLYKTSSLNRCLAFSDEDILLGVSSGPKRAVSSCQLPSKGILKNKENHTDIRKAKSMEVLSPRVANGQGPGQKGKGVTQSEIEQARANFVQGKLQFSAFLDEITKQVISPSDLSILGMNSNKSAGKTSVSAPTSNLIKPQLPPKKHREGKGEALKLPSRQEKGPFSSSRKHSDSSNPDKLISYAARNHHGSPPPRHYLHSASQNSHMESIPKDRRPISGDRFGRCGPHLTDGTNTSPESSQPKQRHHHRKQHYGHHPHNQLFPQLAHLGSGHQDPSNSPPSSAQGAGPGIGSESSSTKSDSSRTRDTVSTATSHSSEQSGRHHSQHVGHSKQHRDLLCDADHLQALQEENADLHQNLLQTVVCIESLEAELQRTRDELSHVKEKYKSLLQTHTGTKQANNILGEHLHIASESLSSERKYLLNRVSKLSAELEDAHRTIAALENINVPCLIKELLEKHFESAEAIQNFLMTSITNRHSTTSQADGQSHSPKADEGAHDWLTKSEAGLQRVTAFMPFKQGVPATGNEGSLSGQHELSYSPPFSVADISTAIYKKMAASYAARPQPVYPQSQQQPSLTPNHAETLPDFRQGYVGTDNWSGKGELKVALLEQDIEDVNSMSAQQILNDFMQHLQPHKEAGGRKEPQSGQKWASGVEQTGKVTD